MTDEQGAECSTDEYAIPGTILRHFDLASDFYSEQASQVIKSRRQSFPDGKLFFDRLLEVAGVEDPESIYPPTTPAGLRRLLYLISSSEIDRLNKDFFFYYLIREADAQHGSRANGLGEDDTVEQGTAHEFVKRRCISASMRTLIDGYWSLDNEEWETAVEHLTDPAISSLNFFQDFIHVLGTHVAPPSLSMSLVRKVLQYTARIIESEKEAELNLISLASTGSLLEAFDFIRSRHTDHQPRMREQLWSWAFGVTGKEFGAGKQGVHPSAISQLVHIPFVGDEHEHLIRFLSRPPRAISSAALSTLHDLVTVRLVHQGQYAECIQLDRESAGSAGNDVERQRRREMVREFISILPAVQRQALDIEGHERATRREQERQMEGAVVNGNVPPKEDTTKTSWIEIDSEPMAVDEPAQSSSPDLPAPSEPAIVQPRPAAAASPVPSRPHSPFTGPPRFASANQHNPALLQRVLSGSPFALPRSVSGASTPGTPVTKPPRRIINDDVDESEEYERQKQTRPVRRTRNSVFPTSTPARATPARSTPLRKKEETPAPKRSRRIVSSSSTRNLDKHKAEAGDKEAGETKSVAARGSPESPPAHRTRSRTPSTSVTGPMPGAFREPTIEPVPEDDVIPPTPARAMRTPAKPNTAARSRMTRSVSRALLDEEMDVDDIRPRKTRRSTREPSLTPSVAESVDVPTPPRSTRRSTRTTRASTAQASDRGSPTPSVAASESGRLKRRSARENSVTQTPRATRSRK